MLFCSNCWSDTNMPCSLSARVCMYLLRRTAWRENLERCAIVWKAGVNKDLYSAVHCIIHLCFPVWAVQTLHHSTLNLTWTCQTNMWADWFSFGITLIFTLRIKVFVHPHEWHWSGLYLLHHLRQFEHKLWTKRMESTVPKASWQEMSRRDTHLQSASHRQGFVGRFLLCAMAALCQGLLPPPEPPVPNHLKTKIRPFCQSGGWHQCCIAYNPVSLFLLLFTK